MLVHRLWTECGLKLRQQCCCNTTAELKFEEVESRDFFRIRIACRVG
jgi:hypothetical protein